jgi:hypothetical protein
MQLRNGNFDIVSKHEDGGIRYGLGEVAIARYAKHWHVCLLRGFQMVDEFDIEGDKHKVSREIRKRGWLGAADSLVRQTYS